MRISLASIDFRSTEQVRALLVAGLVGEGAWGPSRDEQDGALLRDLLVCELSPVALADDRGGLAWVLAGATSCDRVRVTTDLSRVWMTTADYGGSCTSSWWRPVGSTELEWVPETSGDQDEPEWLFAC